MTQAGCAGRHIQRVAAWNRPATPEPRWRGRAATATPPAMLQELNNWAVMNLSMEDRGLLNKELQAPAGSRYLSGDIRCGLRAGLGSDGGWGWTARRSASWWPRQDARPFHSPASTAGRLRARQSWRASVLCGASRAGAHAHPGAPAPSQTASLALAPRTRLFTWAALSRSQRARPAAAPCTSCASAVRGGGWGGEAGATRARGAAACAGLCSPKGAAIGPGADVHCICADCCYQVMSWNGASRPGRWCTRRTWCTGRRAAAAAPAKARQRLVAARHWQTWRRRSRRQPAGWRTRCGAGGQAGGRPGGWVVT